MVLKGTLGVTIGARGRSAIVSSVLFVAWSTLVATQWWRGLDQWALGVLFVGQPITLSLTSDILGTYIWVGAVGYYLLRARHRRQSPLIPLLGTLALAQLVRLAFPFLYYQAPPLRAELVGPFGLAEQGSYPSGHTARAFAGAATLATRSGSAQYLWLALAAATGLTRLLLGVHFVSDVIGGALLGFAAASVMAILHARVVQPSPHD